jgi:hypothetical protein
MSKVPVPTDSRKVQATENQLSVDVYLDIYGIPIRLKGQSNSHTWTDISSPSQSICHEEIIFRSVTILEDVLFEVDTSIVGVENEEPASVHTRKGL